MSKELEKFKKELEEMRLERIKRKKFLGMLVLAVMVWFVAGMIFGALFSYLHSVNKVHYYQSQMTSFCELSKIYYQFAPQEYHNIASADEIHKKDCSNWILGKDK